jgi:hypothetical protein
MSKLSRTILTIGIIGAVAVSAPLLASQFHDHHGDREARQDHHGQMMMARGHGKGEFRHGGARGEHHANMTDEERQTHRQEMRLRHQAMRMHWDTLSEAEQESYKVQAQMRMDERRAEWEAMSPEEREARRAEMHETMQERRGGMGRYSH